MNALASVVRGTLSAILGAMQNPNRNFPTAAEALLRIQEWQDLPLSQRRSLASAVKLLCRIGGEKAPATVRLDPATCLPAIDGASAVALGLTAKTHQNYRAGLRRVLRDLGILAPAHRREPVSDAAWAALLQALPARFHPHRLRAFMGFCAARVDRARRRHQCHPRGLLASPRGEPRRPEHPRGRARGGPAVEQDAPPIAGWPDTALALGPPEGRVQALPFSAYPAGLQTGIERHLAWLAQGPEETAEDDEAAHEPASPEYRSRAAGRASGSCSGGSSRAVARRKR